MRVSLLSFVGVGAVAALVHYIVALLSHYWGLTPANSNWLGFACAFPVSYWGHHTWSFKQQQTQHLAAASKFFIVALLGFLGNQALLWLGLQYTPLPFWLLLSFVMVIVAVSTYVLSRFWAFKHA